jgi:predicted acylesterase/phospholipase RssA/CRP-like cAMP-binding protein
MDLVSRLASTDFFDGLSKDALAQLAVHCQLVPLLGGETLFNQGDDGDSLYLVISGRLRVSLAGADRAERVIREIGPGESVGELALLTHERRSATVRAIRDSELVKLSRRDFERALEKEPKILLPIAKLIAERQQKGHSVHANSAVRTIAVVPTDGNVPIRRFVDRLVRTLGSLGTTLTLDHDQALAFAENNGAGKGEFEPGGKVVHWLHNLEEANRFVVFEAGSENLPWDRLCLRQADRIFVVVSADAAIRTPASVTCVLDGQPAVSRPRTDLVIVHTDSSQRVSGTSQWLASTKAAAHHHVHLDSEADFQKLARDVSGRSVGLVLGGGGARGFAHIGVIRALTEARIPIDYVAGTSMGAVIAAQYARGWDYEDMLRMNKRGWVKFRLHRDLTIPIISCMSGYRMSRMLKRMFGKTEIEDLRRSFFCVSTNLTRAEMMIQRTGLLWRAIRSSIALPVAISPVISKGEIIVDGGLVDNLPVNVMRQFCTGPIIAVDVGQKIDLSTNIEASESLSGLRVLWSRLCPFTPDILIPNVVSLLLRAITVNSDRAVELVRDNADLWLEPPVGAFSTFDWSKMDELAEVGYRYAAQKLEQAGTEWLR